MQPPRARQVLSKEEYACWLQRHLEAETAIQGREELLFESALRLETNLQLLGKLVLSQFTRMVASVLSGDGWTIYDNMTCIYLYIILYLFKFDTPQKTPPSFLARSILNTVDPHGGSGMGWPANIKNLHMIEAH